MVSVAFQIDDNREYFHPGDEVKGDVLLTTSSSKRVRSLTVGIEGVLEWLQNSVVSDSTRSDGDDITDFKIGITEFNPSSRRSNNKQKAECSSTQSGTEKAAGRELTRVQNPQLQTANESSQNISVGITHGNVFPHECNSSSAQKLSSVLLRTDPIELIDTPCTLRPGVHKFPFSVTLPVQADGAPLLSSFGTNDGKVRMQYTLAAKLSTPLLEDFLNIPLWKSYTHPVNVVQRTSPGQLREASENLFTGSNAKVGHWIRESNSFMKLISYALGADTAQSWTQVRVEASFPSLISVRDEPYYLQKSLKLIVRPLEDFVVPIFVEHVKTSVQTRILVNGNVSEIESWNFKNSGNWQLEVNGETDATSLISGAKLNEAMLPTLDHYNLHISHYLKLELKLRSADLDGTHQTGTPVKLILPLRVSDSALDLAGSEVSLI